MVSFRTFTEINEKLRLQNFSNKTVRQSVEIFLDYEYELMRNIDKISNRDTREALQIVYLIIVNSRMLNLIVVNWAIQQVMNLINVILIYVILMEGFFTII